MSTPVVPPRPTARQAPPAEIDLPAQPTIPPRPAGKHLDRGTSPSGRPFAQSPFNEKYDPLSLTKTKSREPIRKRPSVSTLPGLGSEGNEYGEVQLQEAPPVEAAPVETVHQTRNIAEDLKLHAPKPSLPKTSATAQVQPITRTDPTVAAAQSIGRSPSQDGEALGRVISRTSISRPDSAASDRRRSVYEEGPADQGGFRVPINPLLGDVQAPSPAPQVLSPHHTGASGHDGRTKRHHRTKSGREVFTPADSYGLHGHGVQPSGELERDWYAKHPGELKQEEVAGHGVYESIYSGRGAFAMSSDDLNKIVRDTASRGSGFGTTGNVSSYPDEQIGYQASEQYSSKRRTPSLHKTTSNQQVPESPLRKASLPVVDAPSPEVYRGSRPQDVASSNDVDDIHIGAPVKKYNKVTGGEESMRETEDVKPYASHPTTDGDFVNEHGYTVPILAGDEVAKEVGHEHLQPAVSPAPRRDSAYDDEYRHGSSPHTSRPPSRPGSIHGMHSAMHHALQRYISHQDDREHIHTPLEDVDEYEPLFPDDDKKNVLTTAERFKQRPDTLKQRFPSQDVWEDTPDSAMYQATVSTPDLTRTEQKTEAFEPPEVEQARKGDVPEEEKKKLIPAEERLAKSKFAPHLRDDMPTARPGAQPRFPSNDIWEDSPDSQYLVAEVNTPEESPADPLPTVPQRPEKSRLGEGASSQQIEPSIPPNIPARPQKKAVTVPSADTAISSSQSELKQVPSIPDRPKPQIPARPARKDADELTKVTSGGSQESAETVVPAPVPKAKPQVPARPAGGKIANLRSNFMSDLNQKLGLGPPKEKEKEPEPEPEEVKPLEDARKGRARGPQRRAPAKSPSAPANQTLGFSMSTPQSLWDIDDTGFLNVAKPKMSEAKTAQLENSTVADAPMAPTIDTTSKASIEAEKRADDAAPPLASALSTNTAGEHTDPAPVPESEGAALSQRSTTESLSGHTLERGEVDPSTDAIPASKQTTASDNSDGPLERSESVDPATRTENASEAMAGSFPE